MVSLFDRTQQYVIAEATRTLSLRSDSVYEQDDHLWLGCSILPKENGICTLVVDLPVDASSEDPDSEDCGACIIPDLSTDKRFQDRAFVTGTPFARFYVGAPIKSPKGIHIGSYCILDDKPRQGISRIELSFLKDAANAVMVHLELTWAREERQRGERMVQGLGSFHEGMSTLRNHSISMTSLSIDDKIDTLSEWEKRQSIDAGTEDVSLLLDSSSSPHSILDSANPEISPQSVVLIQDQTPDLHKEPLSTKVDNSSRQSIARVSSFETGRAEAHSSSISNEAIFSHNLDLKDALLPTGVKSAFARAANVIRESVEVEGVVFFDASISTRGGLVHTSNGMEDSSDASDYPSTSHRRTQAYNDYSSEQPASISDVFAFSIPGTSSIRGDTVPQGYRQVPERMIQWLLKRYPKGKVISFRPDGTISSGGTEEDVRNGDKEHSKAHPAANRLRNIKASAPAPRQNEAEFLLEIFPGARNIALTPLWDYTRERWFSLGIIWTRSPRRLLTVESDLSYLTAFGNTMMAEIARLDSVAAKKAKADLLGSISHEVMFNRLATTPSAIFGEAAHCNIYLFISHRVRQNLESHCCKLARVFQDGHRMRRVL